MELIGEIIIGSGIILMLCGLIGLIRYKTFYKRLLVSSLIDTAGVIVILLGAAVRQGLSSFSLKIILLIAGLLLICPLVTHKIGRSAYLSGRRE